MSSKARELTIQVVNEFLSKNRNLLALTKEGAHRVMQRVEAAMALMPESERSTAMLTVEHVDGKIGAGIFKTEIYNLMAKAFVRAQRNYAIIFATKITPEALQELEELERLSGFREPLPPPVPVKSAEEQLEDQVREDWVKLETSKFRAKMQRDPAYRAVAERLLAGDGLRTQATALVDGRGFDQ